MRNIHLLLIHGSATFRRILRKVLTAELPELDITDAATPLEAFTFVRENKFDIIVCLDEMENVNGLGICKTIRSDSRHSKVPFIILTSGENKKQKEKYMEMGIQTFFEVPFEPSDFAGAIDSLVDRREWRNFERISIPGTTALFYLQDKRIDAEVINISSGGILDQMAFNQSLPRLADQVSFNLFFPKEYNNAVLKLEGICLRQLVIAWDTPTVPAIAQLGWKFLDMDHQTEETLKNIIDNAHTNLSALSKMM